MGVAGSIATILNEIFKINFLFIRAIVRNWSYVQAKLFGQTVLAKPTEMANYRGVKLFKVN